MPGEGLIRRLAKALKVDEQELLLLADKVPESVLALSLPLEEETEEAKARQGAKKVDATPFSFGSSTIPASTKCSFSGL